MKGSYKVALIVAIVICVIIVVYYVPRGGGGGQRLTNGEQPGAVSDAPGRDGERSPPASPTASAGATDSNPEELMNRVGRYLDDVERRRGDAGSSALALPPSASAVGTDSTGAGPAAATPAAGAVDSPPAPPVSVDRAAAAATVPATGPSSVGLGDRPGLGVGVTPVVTRPADTLPSTVPATGPTTVPGVRPLAATQPRGAASAAGGGEYIIASGDTFSSIAKKVYGSEARWFDIAQANPTVDPSRLKIGMRIRLPDLAAPATRPAAGVDGQIGYTVHPGDTLSTIAQQFYGDPEQWRLIFNANREALGNDPDRLDVGMKLKIPPAPKPAR